VISPTQRTLKLLRKEGWIAEVVEKWIPCTPAGFKGPIKRRDLWGCDVIACRALTLEGDGDTSAKFFDPGEDYGTLMFVQCTSDANVSARVKKLNAMPVTAILRNCARLEVHGWGKKGARGKVKKWECRRVAL